MVEKHATQCATPNRQEPDRQEPDRKVPDRQKPNRQESPSRTAIIRLWKVSLFCKMILMEKSMLLITKRRACY